MRNIYAHTELTLIYPRYLSVNEQEDGAVSVTVRGHHARGGFEGPVATISLTPEQWAQFVEAAQGKEQHGN